MKDIKIIVATHKKYRMPSDSMYIPVHVGREGKNDIGYQGDNTGENISLKNPYYCELTGLYWAWKNLDCEYLGLSHYRRHFSNGKKNKDKFLMIIDQNKVNDLLDKTDIIVPKERKYYIESIYSHYTHTHYEKDLQETRNIIKRKYPDYLSIFDNRMKMTHAHMFNMFIMKKELADQYCEFLFDVLFELENSLDISDYDSFQARLYGRISELLFDVWLDKNNLSYKEVPVIHMEKINWLKKGICFLKAKFIGEKYKGSF